MVYLYAHGSEFGAGDGLGESVEDECEEVGHALVHGGIAALQNHHLQQLGRVHLKVLVRLLIRQHLLATINQSKQSKLKKKRDAHKQNSKSFK